MEDYERGADLIKKSIAVNNSYPLSLITMGNLCFEIERPEKAIPYHQRAIQISPKELKAYIGLGNANYDACNYNDSIYAYEKAL